jgi:hypothetical protein
MGLSVPRARRRRRAARRRAFPPGGAAKFGGARTGEHRGVNRGDEVEEEEIGEGFRGAKDLRVRVWEARPCDAKETGSGRDEGKGLERGEHGRRE